MYVSVDIYCKYWIRCREVSDTEIICKLFQFVCTI